MSTPGPRWLTAEEQLAWRAFLQASQELFGAVEAQLQREGGMPHTYYEILVRLSESPGRSLRMSQLAEASASSKSRVSHAVDVRWGGQLVTIGGDAPVRVQSMTNTDTADAIGTAIQVKELAQAGSELVRITVNTPEASSAPSATMPCPSRKRSGKIPW